MNIKPSKFVSMLVSLSMLAQPFMAMAGGFQYQVPLNGMNTAPVTPGVLSVTQSSHDFGTLVLGSTATTSATIKNTGQNSVSVAGLSVAGPYSQSNNCPSTLVGGASCTMSVLFNPTTAGGFPSAVAIDASAGATNFGVTGTAVVPTTNLTVSPNAVDFGASDVGVAAALRSVTITNAGNSPATVSGIGLSSGNADFSASNNCGAQLTPGASCQISLAFKPTAYAARGGNLNIYEAASSTLYSVALTGFGNAAILQAASAANFGSAIVNYSSSTAQITLTNVGNLNLEGLTADVSAGDFSQVETTCGASIAPAATCMATVKFAPTVVGARTSTLLLASSNGGSASVALSGPAIAQAPMVTTSTTTLTFPATVVGSSSAGMSTTFTNTGNVDVLVKSVKVTSGTANFQLTSTCGTTLAVGSSCSGTLTFSPTAPGTLAGTLVGSFANADLTVALSGLGTQGEATLTATNLTFATTQVAVTSGTQSITVKNKGNRPLTYTAIGIASGGTDFAQTNDCGVIAIEGTCTINVAFTPVAAGTRSGSIALLNDGVGPALVLLSGIGQAQSATLTVPTFIATSVGSNSTGTATLTNTGIGPLSLTVPSAAAVTGTDFSFASTTCAATLAVGLSCNVTVKFAPAAITPRTGSLDVTTGAGPKAAVLAGTGVLGNAALSVSSLTFATQQTATTSSAQEVIVTNNGTTVLTVASVQVTAGAANFTTTHNCTAVAVTDSCVVSVVFNPIAAGALTGTVTLTHNGSGSTLIGLSGGGRAPSATLSAVAFDVGQVGQTYSKSATLTNTGIANISVQLPGASSVTNPNFAFASTNCGPVLAPLASCKVTATYLPTSVGPHSGVLNVTTEAGLLSSNLAGSAQAQAATLSTPTFPDSYSGEVGNVTQISTLTNDGLGPLSVVVPTMASVSAGDFTFVSTTCTDSVAVGSSCNTLLKFQASAGGARTGTFSIATGAGPKPVTLAGVGIAPTATLSTPAFSASTSVNQTSTATAVLTNTSPGAMNLTVPTAASVTGTDFSFSSTTCVSPLAKSATCQVVVQFAPASITARTGSLSFSTASGTVTAALTATGIQGNSTLSSATLAFPAQQTSSNSATQTVTLTNNGTDTLTVTGVTFTAGSADYSRTTSCASVSVGGTCTVTVTFTPSAAGSRPGTVTIAHNGTGTKSFDMTGTGQGQSATIAITNFAATAVGASSTATATITNTGIGSLAITAPSAGSVTGANFTTGTTTCGTSIAVAGYCTVFVKFSPTSTSPVSGLLTVNTGAGSQTVALAATGIQGIATLSAATLTFGAQQTGTSSAAQTVTLTNDGTDVLTVSNVTVSVGATDFTRTTACASVAIKGTCTIDVTFAPTAALGRLGTVTVLHNGTGTGSTTVSLTGTGQLPSATLSTPNFAVTAVNATSTATAALANTGLAALPITKPVASTVSGPGFSFVSTDCGTSIAYNSSCNITVGFTPTTTSAASGSLTVSTAAGSKAVTLGSTGIQGYASISATSLTYGNQQTGTTAAVQSVRVTNTGSNTLTFTGVGVSSGQAEFAQTNDCGSVAVNNFCTVNVSFTPNGTVARTGVLGFTHNGGGIATVNLNGTGQAPTAVISATSWGNIQVGVTSSGVWQDVTNTGIGPISLMGTPSVNAPFAYTSNTCTGQIAAGAACRVYMSFTPTARQTYTQTLVVPTTAGNLTSTSTGTGVLGVAALSANPLVFGEQQTSTTSGTQAVVVTNNGDFPLTLTGVSVTAGSSDFGQSNTCGSAIAPAGTCSITVSFTPIAGGGRAGTVSFTSNGSGPVSFNVSGTGQTPSATLSVPTFSNAQSGQSTTATSTLKNTGLATIAVTLPVVSAVSGTDFSFVSTTCGTSLGASLTCLVTVQFAPTAVTSRSGTLTVNTGAGASSAILTATGVSPSMVIDHINPGASGTTVPAYSSSTLAVYLRNNGLGPVTINSQSLPGGFAYTQAGSGSCNPGEVIAAGALCWILAGYTAGPGSYSGTLTTGTSAGNLTANLAMTLKTLSISVTGNGPSTFTSSDLTVNITNATSGNFQFTSPFLNLTNAAGVGSYSVVTNGCPATLGANGGSCNMVVRYMAGSSAGVGTVTASAYGTFEFNDLFDGSSVANSNRYRGGPVEVANVGLTATTQKGNASLSASGLGYANQTVGTTSGTQTLIITNNGTSSLTISGLSVTAGASDFGQNNDCGAALAPTGTCRITVTFTPTASGARGGTVSFLSNGTGATSFTLGGTGVAVASTTVSVSPTSVTTGGTFSVGWTSIDAAVVSVVCTAPGSQSYSGNTVNYSGWVVPTSGTGTSTCTITPYNSLGVAGPAATASVNVVPTASASIAITPGAVTTGTAATISWSTSNASTVSVSCPAPYAYSYSGTTVNYAGGGVGTSGTGTSICTITPYNSLGVAGPAATASVNVVPTASASISISPTTVTTGGTPTLGWATSNASVVSVSCPAPMSYSYSGSTVNYGGGTVNTTGTGTSTCTLTPYNSQGVAGAAATASVTVIAAPSVASATIANANTTSGTTNTFTWSTSNASSASVACSGTATGSTSGTSGSLTVGTTGSGTGTCTVTASNAAGASATGSASFNVVAPAQVQGAGYTFFSPSTVTAGYGSTLNWSTSGASSASVACSGVSGSGSGTSGSISVGTSAAGTSSCTVTAYNSANSPSYGTAYLTVVAAPAVTGASFGSASVSAGASSNFTWTTSGATSASVNCSGAGANATGSGTSGTISVGTSSAGTATCAVTAYNAASSNNLVTGSSTLTVNSATTTLTSSPTAYNYGTVTNSVAKSTTFTITNAGPNPAVGLTQDVTMGTNVVTITGGTCTAGQTLAAGSSCTMVVRYQACGGTNGSASFIVGGSTVSPSLSVSLGATHSGSGVCY